MPIDCSDHLKPGAYQFKWLTIQELSRGSSPYAASR